MGALYIGIIETIDTMTFRDTGLGTQSLIIASMMAPPQSAPRIRKGWDARLFVSETAR